MTALEFYLQHMDNYNAKRNAIVVLQCTWLDVSHQYIKLIKSLMAEWLVQASQWHEMRHDLEVMSLNPSRIEPGVFRTSV